MKKKNEEEKVTPQGKFTAKEKAYFTKYKDKGVDYLAEKTGRNKHSIALFLGLVKKKGPAPVDPSTKKEAYIDNLFAKRESHGVVVMTEAASMYLDDKKKTHKNHMDQSFIHRPKDN